MYGQTWKQFEEQKKREAENRTRSGGTYVKMMYHTENTIDHELNW